jgi:hypothetical protein
VLKIKFLLIIFQSSLLFGQHDLNWRIGNCTKLNFTAGTLIIEQLADTIDCIYANSSYSKNNSTLSIFTNGTIIYRGDGTIMPGRDSLAPTQ